MTLFESRQLDAQRGVFLGEMRRVRFERFHLLALSGEFLVARDAERFFLGNGIAIEVPLLDGALGFTPKAFQIEPSHGDARVGASCLLRELAHFVIERQRVFLAGLLQSAQPLQFGFQPADFMIERIQARDLLFELAFARRQRSGQLAELALHYEGTTGGLLATGERAAVITQAVGQQEIEIRILLRQPLCIGAILGDAAVCQARQQVERAIG